MAGRRRGQVRATDAPGRWLILVFQGRDTDGKRRYWSKTVSGTKKDAERALTAAQRAQDEGRLEDPSRMPLSAWLSEWLESCRQELRERSFLSYQSWCNLYLEPPLGKIPLADLKPRDVQKAITDLAAGKFTGGTPVGPVTIRNAMGRLRSALAAAVRQRLIPSNPASDAKLPRAPRRGPKRVLAPEEAARFTAAVQAHRIGAFFLLSLGTALRPGEAMGLKWVDVDAEAGLLHVRRSLWDPRRGGRPAELTEPKTASSVRSVPLPPDLLALLRRHRARQAAERLAAGPVWQDQGLIFTREDGRPLSDNTCRYILGRLLKQAGLEHLSLHGLRHSAATLLILAGIDPAHVAAQLGHSSVKTTLEVYVKPSEARLREGADILSKLLRLDQDQGRSNGGG